MRYVPYVADYYFGNTIRGFSLRGRYKAAMLPTRLISIDLEESTSELMISSLAARSPTLTLILINS